MPHAVDSGEGDQPTDQNDDNLIAQMLNPEDDLLQDLLNNPQGDDVEKSHDAVDYEDISDDELPDEEDAGITNEQADTLAHSVGLTESAETLPASFGQDNDGGLNDELDMDDLFGESYDAPPDQVETVNDVLQEASGNAVAYSRPETTFLNLPGSLKPHSGQDVLGLQHSTTHADQPDLADLVLSEDDEDEDEALLEQRRLFAESSERHQHGRAPLSNLPTEPEISEELFQTLFPDFESGKRPRFNKLFPAKSHLWRGREPLKPPKPLQPTKINLELCQDQERTFRLSGVASTHEKVRQEESAQRGIVVISEADAGEEGLDDRVEYDEIDESEMVGGVSWIDLGIVCEDWDVDRIEALAAEQLANGESHHNKKRKLGPAQSAVRLPVFHDHIPSLDDPVITTRKLAKHAILDLNDPDLLVDQQRHGAVEKKRKRPADDFRRDISGSLAKKMSRRYNFSNDHAYDQLKENHQHKVRSTLGNLNIEHSGPAVRLQYPFYKVSLSAREARSFHRPALSFTPNQLVTFGRLDRKKRKDLKGKTPQDVFASSKDLTLGDNSNMTLLEYSEEYPTMMSNFGMGSKIINYYRRKDEDDTSRPKYDLGETQVLLPQDKSPFAIFGRVNPGETVPTLQNALYRAPIFKHYPKGTDFLVGRSSTGIHGHKWYMRSIENMFVVGQEFPSVEVPGTHARKVTETAKKRLKMYSFRIYAKYLRNEGPPLKNEQILEHLPGTDVSANRTKMREFMVYDRERSQWELYPNTVLPDEATMRSWIKPEDLCQIEATQVGERHLMDFGYNKGSADIQDVSQDDKSGVGLEHQLAPWNTTKSFIQAANGKAMLELHGEGDPSGRGEAFSMIKTSMKGGFQAIGESVEDQLKQKALREATGHQYNVSQQWDSYHAAIKKIWTAQSQSLSSTIEHSDTEMDVDDEEPGDASFTRGQTPHSEYGTPTHGHRDDETISQPSRHSSTSHKGKVLKIIRNIPDKHGKLHPVERVVTDPKVMREYIRRRRANDLNRLSLEDLKPTGNAEIDARQRQMLEEELARLHRNKERRHVREKAKGIFDPDGESPGGGKAVGTQRRCANCGQVGHIKTNKKLCPMLNGTMNAENGAGDGQFGSPTVDPSSQAGTPAAGPGANPFSFT